MAPVPFPHRPRRASELRRAAVPQQPDPDATERIPDIAHVADLRGDVWLTPREADKARRFVDASASMLAAVDGLLRRDGGRLEQVARIAVEVQRLAGEDDQAAHAFADELARLYATAEQLRAAGGLLPDELRGGTRPVQGGATHAPAS